MCRLEQLSVLQNQRLTIESSEERVARLQHLQKNWNAHQNPLFNRCHAQERIQRFHRELWSLETVMCLICLEKFPGMKLTLQSECQRCHRDKNTLKLYSSANNMSPGSIPSELEVSTYYNKINNYELCMYVRMYVYLFCI